jgi:NADH-quinone oxidoreductase subunit M
MPHLLTVLVLLPAIGALVAVLYSLIPGHREDHYKWIALVVTISTFGLSLLLLTGTGTNTNVFQFEDNVVWIGSIGSRYHVAVDGISLWLVLLTTLLMPIAILSSWTAIKKRQLAYYAFMLILASAMIGVFVSLDLLLFYLFFEASLIPMFFLIGIWGGERRIYEPPRITASGARLKRARYCAGATPTRRAKARRMVSGVPNPQRVEITSTGSALASSSWRARSTLSSST